MKTATVITQSSSSVAARQIVVIMSGSAYAMHEASGDVTRFDRIAESFTIHHDLNKSLESRVRNACRKAGAVY